MKSKLFAIAIIACLCYACTNRSNESIETKEAALDTTDEREEANKTTADSTNTPQPPPPPKQEERKPEPANAQADWDKKIIKTGNLSMEVKNFKAYGTSLTQLVKRYGGYIASEEETEGYDRIENKVTIKVPVAQFGELVNSLENSDGTLREKHISSEDVTGEVVDNKLRVEAKKKIRDRYLELLHSAKSMEDILSIQSELNNVQEEIELAEGRTDFLTHSSALSTIELHYYQVVESRAIDNDKPSFIHSIKEAVSAGWNGVSTILLTCIAIWPLWIVLAGGIFLYKRNKRLAHK